MNKRTVGILGGGQLARMLVEAAFPLGLKPIIFTDNPKSCAIKVCPDVVISNLLDRGSLQNFFSQVELVIFENEFIPCFDLLGGVGNAEVSFYPSLETIDFFQNKHLQKQFLQHLEIPTAPFLIYEGEGDFSSWIETTLERFDEQCVFKWGRMGYDGKGVFLKESPEQLREVVAFCQEALEKGLPLYAEKRIPFKRELAIIGCYGVNGEFATYPLVVSEQEQGICKRVFGPATTFGVSERLDTLAREYARKIAEKTFLIGSFGIEFFETQEGELLVNEIAPRVHNSGHYTMNAADTSQFENHWRAVLGLPLGSTKTSSAFAMLNLLGAEELILSDEKVTLPTPSRNLHLHWYDKGGVSPRRKLGHLNGTVENPNDLSHLLAELDQCYTQWVSKLRSKYAGVRA